MEKSFADRYLIRGVIFSDVFMQRLLVAKTDPNGRLIA